jgi:Metallo-beta-lactamase superfamily
MPQKIFTLEALAAKHGDSLLLHWGSAPDPHLVVIDGGPSGVFNAFLRKRLEQLRRAPGRDPLPIDVMMVSHVDDDHIHGILDLTRKLEEVDGQGGNLPWEIDDLWHNAFDDVLGNAQARAFGASLTPAVFSPRTRHAGATIASVGQGRTLRDRAQNLAIPTNGGDDLIVGGFTWNLGDGLELSVVGPRRNEIVEFRKVWDKEVKKRGWATRTAAAEVAAFVDKSPFNLASIVVLARLGSKTMLLTGDARGDHVLEGLRADGYLSGSSMKVNILKVPHHGSDRNVDTAFFRTLKADHYVISGNGEYGNPDMTTLQMIVDARGSERFQVHCTYRNGIKGHKARMKAFLDRLPSTQRRKFLFRPESELSLRVHLGRRFSG